MATVTLRFYGRFVFAQGTDRVVALAPKLTSAPTHRPTMSIHHGFVKFLDVKDKNRPLTTLQPMLRIASDMSLPNEGDKIDTSPQILIWDLDGLAVSFGEPQSPTGLVGQRKPLDLKELESLLGRNVALKRAALRPGSLVSTTFEIVEASGTSRAVSPQTVQFGKFADVEQNEDGATPIRDAGGTVVEKSPADLVEFSVPFNGALLELRFNVGAARHGIVTVKDGALVAFSHFCPTIAVTPPAKFDLEFAQYYELVDPVPSEDDRVVPFLKPGLLGEGMGCHLNSKISI